MNQIGAEVKRLTFDRKIAGSNPGLDKTYHIKQYQVG